MHHRPKLGEFTLFSAGPPREVVTDVPSLHSGGVDASQAALVWLILPGTFQQSSLACLLDVHIEQASDGTFFSSRFSAWMRVGKCGTRSPSPGRSRSSCHSLRRRVEPWSSSSKHSGSARRVAVGGWVTFLGTKGP